MYALKIAYMIEDNYCHLNGPTFSSFTFATHNETMQIFMRKQNLILALEIRRCRCREFLKISRLHVLKLKYKNWTFSANKDWHRRDGEIVSEKNILSPIAWKAEIMFWINLNDNFFPYYNNRNCCHNEYTRKSVQIIVTVRYSVPPVSKDLQ